MKFVFIGNSIVAGFPWKRTESFPGIIRQTMESPEFKNSVPGGNNTRFQVINKGLNGDTTIGILDRFADNVIAHHPDYAFILTGTNDFIYRIGDPETCLSNLLIMEKMCLEDHITPVLCTPIPISPKQAAVQWQVEDADYISVSENLARFSELIRSYGRNGPCHTIDLYTPYSGYCKFYDGLHPDREGQELIASAIMEWMKENVFASTTG